MNVIVVDMFGITGIEQLSDSIQQTGYCENVYGDCNYDRDKKALKM
jgi:hypothetical protein